MLSLRSCLIGCWMGISPAGATPASFMSYGIAKRISKRGQNFGKGEIEGVIAPETAAHAAGTSALLPMISLGVPGSPTAAVLLGGFDHHAAAGQTDGFSRPALIELKIAAFGHFDQ